MAQLSDTVVCIDGKEIKQFSSLTISQAIFAHHTFRVVCPAESIDGTSGELFNTSKDMLGSTLSVSIQSVGNDDALEFTGVVTLVEAARHSGHAGEVVISGFSPTILLDNALHCKSWEKKSIKNIADDVLKYFPQNLLQPQIQPNNSDTFSYTVQYKETAWNFLNRLSARYGEWLYYNGTELVLGAPKGNNAKLIFGSNLPGFNMSLQVRPAKFQLMAYDYLNTQTYDASPSGVAGKAGLNELGKHALSKSEKFYATQPKQWHNQFLTSKKNLEDYVDVQSAIQASSMVRLSGHSGNPGIQVSGSLSVNGKNYFTDADDAFGEYTVISVNHHADGQGNYQNDFVAIPATLTYPPAPMFTEPHCETQSAIVTDNNDPDGLGRARVKFHWMNGSEKSPWLRITSPHGGGGKGMFFIPEKDEEVIIGFEGDSAHKPYIIGTVYHGKAKNEFGNAGNDVKTIQTRSGNKVVMNDKEGSVFVEDKDGNSMRLDGEGNITLKSNKTVLVEATDEITFQTKKITMVAENEITMESKKFEGSLSEQASLSGTNLVELISNNKIELSSSNEVAIAGTTKASVSALQTEISGTAQTTVQGAMVKLNC